jgi:hypothetical protein
VSKDHGTTWRRINYPADAFRGALPDNNTGAIDNPTYPFYVNGMFVITFTNNGSYKQLFSADGMAWQVEPIGMRVATTSYQLASLAHKSGVYAGVCSASTDALSATEDKSKFRMPSTAFSRHTFTAGSLLINPGDQQTYVKVLL